MSLLIEMLKSYEGLRLRAYKCTEGHWTIGYGFLIPSNLMEYCDTGGVFEITEGTAGGLLHWAAQKARRQAAAWVGGWCWNDMLPARQDAIASMAYQMGVGPAGLGAFNVTLKAIRSGEWGAAARHALASKWASQTPDRARETCEILRTGEYPSWLKQSQG